MSAIRAHNVLLEWRICELDRDGLLRPDAQLFDAGGVKAVNDGEIPSVLPQKLDKPQLAQDAHDVVCSFLYDDDTMHASAKDLNGMREVCSSWQRYKRLLVA